MRWKIFTEGDDRWAWDTKTDKIYKLNKGDEFAGLVPINIQQLDKFVPYMKLSRESDTKPSWVDNSNSAEHKLRKYGRDR